MNQEIIVNKMMTDTKQLIRLSTKKEDVVEQTRAVKTKKKMQSIELQLFENLRSKYTNAN